MSLNHRGTQRGAEEKYKAYPEYKDSGVEWLGSVPSDWAIKKLKYLCKIQTGSKDTVNAVDGGTYPFFVRSQTIERINSIGADCEAVLTAGDGVGVGKVYHYYQGKFDYHQRVYMLSDFSQVTGRFVYYYLSSNFYKVALEGNAKSTVDSLRLPQFLNFEFSLPSIEEQKQIAAFLDRETAKIDTLIDKQKKLIALLKEKRQAIISHAVTKGLNPTNSYGTNLNSGSAVGPKGEGMDSPNNAPMRNSGTPWLGKIPAHWVERPLKFMAQIKNGRDYKHVEVNEGEGYPVIGSGGEFTRASDFLFSGSSVLLGRKGTIDKPLYIEGAFWTVDTMYYTDIAKNTLPKYLYYCALTIPFDYYSTNTALPSMTQGDLGNHLLLYPPFEEQREIVCFIEEKTAQIDKLVSKAEQAIELIQERRTALISAAVTGKIDARSHK